MKKIIPYITSAIVVISLNLYASPSQCPDFYLDGEAPAFMNEKMKEKTQELCFQAFAVMHSGITKTPLWSAEFLTRNSLQIKVPRKDVFHEETRLPIEQRAELRDYSKSLYDRGHMAPSADMPTKEAQAESFSLSNIIPQDSNSNSFLWADIEATTRYLAKKEGALYVITGPVFKGTLKSIGNRVLVPTFLYKMIYSPKQQKAAAYIAKNASGRDYQVVSIKELEDLTGINFFPKMSASQKALILELPEPKEMKH